MKRFGIALLLLAAIVVITWQGCKKEDEQIEYVIKIDSVTHADTIVAADGFEVHFYGKVGDNDCFAFSRFLPAFGPNDINVTVYGIETVRNDCSGSEVWLDGKGAIFFDMTPGDWTLYVQQPNGLSPLESTVYVK